MRLSLRLDTRDLRRLTKRIDEYIGRINRLDPVMEDIAEYMVRSVRHRILRSKTAPNGTPWARNSDLTQQLKGADSPLFQTGTLAKSIRVGDADGSGFTVSATADYAPYMQGGLTRGQMRGKYRPRRHDAVPAREFMGISSENKDRIRKMLLDYIMTGRDTPEWNFGE